MLHEIGERLRSERERLGFTIKNFAKTYGASERSLSDWERGVAPVNVVFLSAIFPAGADVCYILTGRRSQLLEPPQPPEPSIPGYPEIDAELVLDVMHAVEMYLFRARLTVRPEKKARLVRLITQMVVDRRRKRGKPPGKTVDLVDLGEAIFLASEGGKDET